MGSQQIHDATAVALAFRYQERRALFDLMETQNDEASVAVEALDDVQVNQPGLTLIEQVKHSIQAVQPVVTVKSPSLWKTLRIWCELLPKIDLNSIGFVFVCTSPIDEQGSLNALRVVGSNRETLLAELDDEATRVLEEINLAVAAKNSAPYKDKKAGTEAWLGLTEEVKRNLLERVTIKPDAPNVDEQEVDLAKSLINHPEKQRLKLANRLLTWWDGEILHSMQKKREKFIAYHEVIEQLSILNSMLEKDEFFETYSSKQPPPLYNSDEMLAKQCGLVNASKTTIDRARALEWQARSQRAVWADESPTKAERLGRYDETLVIEWKAQHDEAVEAADLGDNSSMAEEGHNVLKWSTKCTATEVGNIDAYTTPPFYVRGSFQTLSIDGRVGWHPHFKSLLGFKV